MLNKTRPVERQRIEAELAIVQAELNGDAGYQAWADAEPDEEIKRLLLLNGREETIHGNRVREAIELLRADA